MGSFVYAADCPHCGVAKVAFTGWAFLAGQDGTNSRIPLSCAHCREVIVLKVLHHQSLPNRFYQQEEEINLSASNSPVTILGQYPRSITHEAPADVPDRIAGVFVEALENLARGKYETCIFLCGKALDLSTRSLDQSWNLGQRLKKLANDGKISSEMADWAEEIRIDRNGAAHEDVEFEKTDAEEIVGFTEAFLNYLFTLPALVKARRHSRNSGSDAE